MANLRDVLAYLCFNYPNKSHLSKARLTKLVYLSDWKSALTTGSQLTGITWFFNHYGPYVNDIVELAYDSPDFEVISTANIYGDNKETINYIGSSFWPSLDKPDKEILDKTIDETSKMIWNNFIKHVYETYPVRTQQRYNTLNLEHSAQKYKSTESHYVY